MILPYDYKAFGGSWQAPTRPVDKSKQNAFMIAITRVFVIFLKTNTRHLVCSSRPHQPSGTGVTETALFIKI